MTMQVQPKIMFSETSIKEFAHDQITTVCDEIHTECNEKCQKSVSDLAPPIFGFMTFLFKYFEASEETCKQLEEMGSEKMITETYKPCIDTSAKAVNEAAKEALKYSADEAITYSFSYKNLIGRFLGY